MRNKDTASLVVLSLIFCFSGCTHALEWNEVDPLILRGSGNLAVEYREIIGFRQISLAISGEVTLKQGKREIICLETDDNLVQFIQTEVSNDTLFIRFSKEVTNFRPSKPNRISIEFKELEGLKISGSSDLKSNSLTGEHLEIMHTGSGDVEIKQINVDSLLIDLSSSGSILSDDVRTGYLGMALGGSGDIQFRVLNAEKLDVEVLGSGDVKLSGQVNRQHISIPGSGDYQAGDLRSERTLVGMVATGRVTVWAEELLGLRIFPGKGKVAFYGNPKLKLALRELENIKRLGTR